MIPFAQKVEMGANDLTKLLEGYSDAELILITEFIDGMIKINHEQAGQK